MNNPKSNVLNKFKEFVNSYLDRLGVEISKTSSKIDRDKTKRKILEFSYNLNGKFYTQEELSYLLNVTSERVRQIKLKAVEELRSEIIESDSNIFTEYYFEDLKILKENMKSVVVLSQNGFNKYLKEQFQISVEENDPFLILLIDVLDYKVIRVHLHLLKENNLIFFDKTLDTKLFVKICYATYIAIEKNTIPIEINDVIIDVKRNLKKEKFENQYILLALNAIDDCELIQIDGTRFYQVAFHRLSSATDMAYRILFEKKERLTLVDIFREINHRLSFSKRKTVDKFSLNHQMNGDKRFLPLGRVGVWTLAEWGEDNLSIFELITNTFLLFNKPLTKKEIFIHIQKTRSFITTRTLNTYMYDGRYTTLNDKTFILSEWKDTYKSLVVKSIKKPNPVK